MRLELWMVLSKLKKEKIIEFKKEVNVVPETKPKGSKSILFGNTVKSIKIQK